MRSSPSTYEVITCSSRQLTRRAFLGSCRFVPSEGRGGRNDEGGHPKGPPRLLTRQEESSGVAPLVQDSHFPHDRWTGDRGRLLPEEATRHSFPMREQQQAGAHCSKERAHDQPSRVDGPTGRAPDQHFL